MVGNVVLAACALCTVLYRSEVNAGLAGLALSYAMTITTVRHTSPHLTHCLSTSLHHCFAVFELDGEAGHTIGD